MYSINLEKSARILSNGGLVAHPTEGVYGIACLPFNFPSVARLLSIKKRSWKKGLILIASDIRQIDSLVHMPNNKIKEEILNSWPGPTTWLLKARKNVPFFVKGDHETIAIRITNHDISKKLCYKLNSPLVSTSANIARRKPLKTALGVRKELGKYLDFILSGPLGNLNGPTMLRNGLDGSIIRE